MGRSRPFGRARWLAPLWLVAWAPAYATYWGWSNFLALCDVAVIVSCVGFWRGSPLLLSSQALPSVVVGALWGADVVSRVAAGKHVFGGTEYMWDGRVPLAVRMASLFHLALPVLLIAALRRVGYDRRALALQTGITAGLLLAARALTTGKNLNYALRDPLFGRELGPPPVHLATVLAGIVGLIYLPTHLALSRWLPDARAVTDRAPRT